MAVSHPDILQHAFLDEMYRDSYFPDALVDKGKDILLRLCDSIELEKPRDIEALYVLTHHPSICQLVAIFPLPV